MGTQQGDDFQFRDLGQLIDDDLELVVVALIPAQPLKGYVPCYHFEMRRTGTTTRMGDLFLRVGHTELLRLFGGHVGYGVDPGCRGHRYAARSCRLVFPLAKEHELTPLWITCNSDNWASRRTCELAGGVLAEILDTTPESDAYQRGEYQKCRYCFNL